MRRLPKFLPPALGLLLLAGIGLGLRGFLRHTSLADVFAAFAATPAPDVLRALGLLTVSFCIMAAYDLPGVTFARRTGECAPLPFYRIGLASICAYALSHVLGATALSAAAIRLRFYSHWGVPPAGLGRIVALSGSSFSLGIATLLGALLLADPGAVPLPGDMAPPLLRLAGALLLAVPAAYVGLARRFDSVRIFGRRIALPGPRIAVAQTILSCMDIACSCAILHTVLPPAPGLSYPVTLILYAGAFMAGSASGLPGGVGVFDSVLLLGFSDYLSASDALGAILLFRVMYFLAPASFAGLCYMGHEFWIHVFLRDGKK